MQRGNAKAMAGAVAWKDQIFSAFTVQAGKCPFFKNLYIKGYFFFLDGKPSNVYVLFLK